MKYVIFVAMAALLTACGPSNFNECVTEAAKAPTQQGVNAGVFSCSKRFPGN